MCVRAQIDILCASQPLLQGVIVDPEMSAAEVGIEPALATAREILFYMDPLAGEWLAPPHPFLLKEQGEPKAEWMRRGPAALTRAWCILELAKALALGRTLHVLLSPASSKQFEERMTRDRSAFADQDPGFTWVTHVLGCIDVKLAQITKEVDRSYILREVEKLEGGLGAVNANVMGALHLWLTSEAKALLVQMPEEERLTSALPINVGVMLTDVGQCEEGEKILRAQLTNCRKMHGESDPHPNMRATLNYLAFNLFFQLRYEEAEPFFRDLLGDKSQREALITEIGHPATYIGVSSFGAVLHEQGKLEDAEEFCVEAKEWASTQLGPEHVLTVAFVGNLVNLRRKQGRLDEAEEMLGSLVAVAREALGPTHEWTLETEAVAARLKIAQPNGAAEGEAKLRDVVKRMKEFLGPTHRMTLKWSDTARRRCH